MTSTETLKDKHIEVQAVVNPITSKVYDGARPGGYSPGEESEDDGQGPFHG